MKLENLLNHLVNSILPEGCSYVIQTKEGEKYVLLQIITDDDRTAAILIGKRGSTVRALKKIVELWGRVEGKNAVLELVNRVPRSSSREGS